ncbi:MAG: adenylate/guanylate cyclase domain-containing protein [Planctomycetes bacterium]|nr:adenylate/guanylate cyclase domain-containing protein [Planctomycetota bacterium]
MSDRPVDKPPVSEALAVRQLRVVEAVDTIFDVARNASVDEVIPKLFALLRAEVPGFGFFARTTLPDYEEKDTGETVAMIENVLVTEEADREAAQRAAVEAEGTKGEAASVTSGNCLLVPLRRRGGRIGWLGAVRPAAAADGVPGSSAGASAQASETEWLLAALTTVAQRLDSELEIHSLRLHRRILASKLNRALEDYYLDRGISRAINILMVNGVCEGVYVAYDRSGLQGEPDVSSQFHWVWGVEEMRLPHVEVETFLKDPSLVPGCARERIAGVAGGLTVPLRRRDFDGKQQCFGCITFIGSAVDYSSRMLLEEFANVLDSAMINYHEKRRELSRFLSPPLVRQLLQGDRTEIERRMAPRPQLLALAFADIVGYSRLCSRYPEKALQTAALLCEWKRLAREITYRRNGIVDKFIGDCLFYQCGAWTKDPPEQLVLDAAAIALDCCEETEKLGRCMSDYGFSQGDSLRLSVGIHVGSSLVVGEIGGEFTAIGSDVNIASRIQDDDYTSGRIVVSQAVYQLLAPSIHRLDRPGRKVTFGEPASLELKGVGQMKVYALQVNPA